MQVLGSELAVTLVLVILALTPASASTRVGGAADGGISAALSASNTTGGFGCQFNGSCVGTLQNLTSTTGGASPCIGSCPDIDIPAAPSNNTGGQPLSYSGHYFVGATYCTTNPCSSTTRTSVTTLYTTIGTPSSGARWNDLYYTTLSAWDSNHNYDQLGIASDHCSTSINSKCLTTDNHWQVMYSVGTPGSPPLCTISYNLQPKAQDLAEYSDYTFEMTLSSGYLWLYVYAGTGLSGTQVYANKIADSATAFYMENTDNYCGSLSAGGFQVLEEVYDISSSMSFPQWNTGFAYTYGGTTQVTTWTSYASPSPNTPPTSPHGYYVDFPYSYFVRVDNVAGWISFSTNTGSVPPGGVFGTFYGSLNANGGFCSGTSCPVTVTCVYPWTSGGCAASPADVPSSSISYYANVNSGATAGGPYFGEYLITITSTTPNEFTTFIFYIYVT